MDTKKAFAKALRQSRIARGLTQEDFTAVSSRTYLSVLERGLKSPTLEKIETLAATLQIHPLTLLALTYLYAREDLYLPPLLQEITEEIEEILSALQC